MAQIAETEIEALSEQAVAALVDQDAIAHFGSDIEAAQHVLIGLGLSDGDLVQLAGPGIIELGTPLDEIRANLTRALDLKRQGWPTARILVDGLP